MSFRGLTFQKSLKAFSTAREPKQPAQQEPVALEAVYETIIHWDEGGGKRSRRELARRIVSLYTTPPKRPWVGLTDEKIAEVAERMEASDPTDSFWREFARAIEAAHNIGVNT